jgi:hypothetical protein
MKRSLLLIAVTLVALAIPTVASACTEICEGAFGPCVYEEQTSSYCVWSGNVCWMRYCFTGSEDHATLLLSSKWKIASVEIERPGPAGTRESEVRVASNTEAAKREIPSLE